MKKISNPQTKLDYLNNFMTETYLGQMTELKAMECKEKIKQAEQK